MDRQPIIGVTMGDAAGIGPEIVLTALTSGEVKAQCLVIGDAKHLGALALDRAETSARGDFDAIAIHDLKNLPDDVLVGIDSEITGRAAAENIVAAVELWKEGKIDAICTAPISKKA